MFHITYICMYIFFNSFIKRLSGTPVIEQIELIFLTHCRKEECTPWGNKVWGGGEGGKEPTMGFWPWVDNLQAGLRMFVLDWVLSESGGNAIIEYLINFICREGRRAKIKAEMAQEAEVTHTSCQRGVFGISWITWRFWSGCSLRLFTSKRRKAWLFCKH